MAKWNTLIKRTLRYSITSSIIVISSCMVTGVIVFLKADRFKNDLQTIVKYKTGFDFDYSNIKTGFNENYEPYIYLDNLTLDNQQYKSHFKLNKLRLILSLSSVTKLAPIFQQIELDGTKLNIVINHGKIEINNYPIESTDDSNSYIGKLLIQQQNIKITDIDTQLSMPGTPLKKLTIDNNSLILSHQKNGTNIELATDIQNNHLNSTINFVGNDLLDITSWKTGTVKIKSTNKRNYLINLNAQITNGEVDFITGKLDNNDNPINYSKEFKSLTDVSGALDVRKNKENSWDLKLKSINVQSKKKILIDNLNVYGKVTWSNGGTLNVDNFSIDDIGDIVSYFESSIDIHSTGVFSSHISWDKQITNPQNIISQSSLTNLSIKSSDTNIPSINNAYIKLNTNNSKVNGSIALQNSTIKYPSVMFQPITISLNSNLDVNLESASLVNLRNISVKNNDFAINGQISYNLESNIVDAKLMVPFFNLAKAYKYVPVAVGKNAADDFEKNLQGMMQNIKIAAHGSPESFPFINESSSYFTVDGNINNINYLWQDGWPKLLNTNGILKVRNQNVLFTVGKSQIGNLRVHDGTARIPNFVANKSELIVSGSMTNPTEEFMKFGLDTPYKEQVKKATDNISIDGNASTKLTAKVSLNTDDKTTLMGTFTTNKNTINLPKNIQIADFNSAMNFNQDGIQGGNGHGYIYDAPLSINFTENKVTVQITHLAIDKLTHSYPKLDEIINGTTNINLTYDQPEDLAKIKVDLTDTEINAPEPLGKSKDVAASFDTLYDLGKKEITSEYYGLLSSKIKLTESNTIDSANIYLGTRDIDEVQQESGNKINVTVALNNTYFEKWADFAKNIANALHPQDEPHSPKDNESQTVINNIIESNFLNNESQVQQNQDDSIYPIGITWNSNSFWYKNYNLNRGNIKAYIYPNIFLAQMTTPDIEGRFAYTKDDNRLDINMDRVVIAQDSLYTPESTNLTQTFADNESADITPETTVQFESQIALESADANKLVQQETNSNTLNAEESMVTQEDLELSNINESNTSEQSTQFPNVNFRIKNLYLNNYYWGSLDGNAIQQENDLIIDNATLNNNAVSVKFNLINHCFTCSNKDEKFVVFNLHAGFKNFGELITKTGQVGYAKNGIGIADVNGSWSGDLDDFSLNKLTLYSDINLKDGVILKIKPGLFGALMGVVSFSAIDVTNLSHLSMNSLFGQSFAFTDLSADLYLNNGVLNIEKFNLNSEAADITTIGRYYINDQNIDTIMTVEPKIDGTIATTVGIVTLNPFIGGIVYLAEKFLGSPIGGLLTTSYHVEGDVNNPTIKATNIGTQFINNMTKSGVKLLPVNTVSKAQQTN